MLNQIITDLARLDSRSSNNQRRTNAFIVNELFAPSVANAVVPKEDDDGIVEGAFRFQLVENPTNQLIRVLNRIQILSPVLENQRISGIVRWQLALFPVGSHFPRPAAVLPRPTVDYGGSYLPKVGAGQRTVGCHLLPHGRRVVHGFVPLKVVIVFPRPSRFFG